VIVLLEDYFLASGVSTLAKALVNPRSSGAHHQSILHVRGWKRRKFVDATFQGIYATVHLIEELFEFLYPWDKEVEPAGERRSEQSDCGPRLSFHGASSVSVGCDAMDPRRLAVPRGLLPQEEIVRPA
jgi:hypothetical protein